MKKVLVVVMLMSIVFTGIVCKKSTTFSDEFYDTRLSGGAATVFLSNAKAFGSSIDGLSTWDSYIHDVGDKLFAQTFISSPAPHFQGLGPIYNNVSCVSCHHNDSKGIPTAGLINSGLLTRISIPGEGPHGAPLDIPGFGTQLQDKAVSGKTPEGKLSINYENKIFTYPDGSTVTLRKPSYSITAAYMTLPANHMISVRLGPPVFGLGLLELIPEETILALSDENDRDGDGISGKANYVWNPVNNRMELGRFGLKANNPSLLVQVAGAYHQDMGITNPVFSREAAFGQAQSDGLNDDPEISDSMLRATTFYIQSLAVPARRNVDDVTVLKGQQLFNQLNCKGCHTPLVRTGVDLRMAALSNQRIQPFTDLLLHDMGVDLADGRPDYKATGSEWRTAPLWGLGLLPRVNGNAVFYLHDGRARTLEEAILWHGGEAERSKQQFVQLSKTDRDALLRFLQSL
ncbi:thiol oxidoreductase [Taibaiella sp. KBW10]|uniref:di-heme oxidoreductase family protein n=1 Tax=Taibaiella sp. KBW10 TaxID=2153357 RepID=UPI000F593F23|nr:di-heme oxidoredictase family protein [Taibaiella sp. KBW10]RQO31579.1 thiol oxidoreductase [Taibaiella sp. KBW10]